MASMEELMKRIIKTPKKKKEEPKPEAGMDRFRRLLDPTREELERETEPIKPAEAKAKPGLWEKTKSFAKEPFGVKGLWGPSPEMAKTLAAQPVAIGGSAHIAKGFSKIDPKKINKVATMFGKTPEWIEKIVKSRVMNKEISKIVKGATTASSFAAKAGKWVAGGAVGTDILMTWYALDNIITGQNFFINDIDKALNANKINVKDAREAIDTSQSNREAAIRFVKLSAIINPLLWPFRNLILTGVGADDAKIEFSINQIEETMTKIEAGEFQTEQEQEAESEEAWEKRISEAEAREEKKRAYYEKLRQETDAKEKEKREYYARMIEEAEARKAETRKYFGDLRKEKEAMQKSQLRFGILGK